jgi:hypothetical protein
LATDPDRFAIVATRTLSMVYGFSERAAARIAIEHFGSQSKSVETIRWKARKLSRLIEAAQRIPGLPNRINFNLWTSAGWLRLMQISIDAAIQKSEEKNDINQRIVQVMAWANLADEKAFAETTLIKLVQSGFGFRAPKNRN